jgi:hypothetical protein
VRLRGCYAQENQDVKRFKIQGEHMSLKCETNTEDMDLRVQAAFCAAKGVRSQAFDWGSGRDYETVFEHGQWFVLRIGDGFTWSVVDASPGVDGFDFEALS